MSEIKIQQYSSMLILLTITQNIYDRTAGLKTPHPFFKQKLILYIYI